MFFLEETHSLTQDEKMWKDDFKAPLFFSHGSTNSCGVSIGFCGVKSLQIFDKKSDENDRILIIDAKVNDEKFLLVNIYNSNIESEQIKTLDTLKTLLENIDNISDKKNNDNSWWRLKFIRWIKSGIMHNKRGTNNKLFQIKKRYKTRRPFISISFHSRLRNSIH